MFFGDGGAMKIQIFSPFPEHISQSFKQAGLELVEWEKDNNLPIYLPYGAWSPSFLKAVSCTKTVFITPQKSVAECLISLGAQVKLLPISLDSFGPLPGTFGLMPNKIPCENRSIDVIFMGSPHKVWLKLVNMEKPVKLEYGTAATKGQLNNAKIALMTDNDTGYAPWIFEAIRYNTVTLIPESLQDLFPLEAFPSYTEETLISVVEKLIKSPEDLKKYSDNALEWMKTKCSGAVLAKNISDLQLNMNDKPIDLHPLESAEIYKELGRWDLVIPILEMDIQENESSVILNNLGVAKGIQNLPEVEELFNRAGSRLAFFNLGCYYFCNERDEEALDCLKKSLAIEERFEGWIYPALSLGDATWLPISRSLPGSPEWENLVIAREHELIGRILWKMGKQREAIKSMREAYNLIPENADLLYLLGGYYLATQMIAQPIKYWSKMLQLDPFNFDMQRQFASIYSQMEMYEQAIHLLEQGVKFPDSLNTYRNQMLSQLGYNYYQSEKYPDAMRVFKDALQCNDADKPALYGQLALVYVKQAVGQSQRGLYEEARTNIKEAFIYEKNSPIVYNVLGSIAYQEGELIEAKDAFNKALSIDPDFKVARINLDECLAAEKITVSIVLVSHNDQRYAKLSLDTVTQFTDLPYEIIYLYPYGETPWEFLKDLPNLRLIQANYRGLAEAYNIGLSYTKGRFIVFMEDDVTVGPNWLSPLILPLKSDPVIGATGPVTNYCLNPLQIPSGVLDKKENKDVELLDSFCFATRRDVLIQTGNWDPQFIVRGLEDNDLCLRLQIDGKRLVMVPDAFVSHIGLMPYAVETYDADETSKKNQKYFEEKWNKLKGKALALR